MIDAEIIPYKMGTIPDEIMRNLHVLYGTREGEQALDREFGLSWMFVDNPLPIARARIANEIIQKTQKYEPRVRVRSVDYTYDAAGGVARPKVVIALV